VQNGDKQATIQLSAGNNGGSAITSYTYSINDSEPVTISSISSPLVLSNLSIGTLYSFQIKATNSVGDSTSSTASFTGMSVPDAPVIVGATAGNKTMVVEFFAPNANSSTITGYKYSIAAGVYTSATLLDASHISITGLSENTEYTVKLAAVNAIGQSDDSNIASATPYTYPLSPTIGTITVSNGSASVEFTARSDNSSAITAYSYSLNNGSYITYSSLESPLELNDLSNGVAYTIRMKAINTAGSSVSASSASFMPRTVPESPTITSVTAGNHSCEIGFIPGFFNGATITKYRYSFNGVDFQDATGTTSPITIDGLTNGTTYMVYLLAVNSEGESNISAPSSAFVPFVTQSTPNPPEILSVVSGNESVTVVFTDGINLGSAIKGYMYSVDGGETRYWAKQTQSPLTIIGLVNGVEQSIQLCAVNNSGPSEWSEPSNLFTPCDVPGAPILTGVQGADSSIVVSFVSGSSNGAAVSSYEYSLNDSTTYSVL
jgi:titin